jgi:two-component system phosphate regulon response regulator OmpR
MSEQLQSSESAFVGQDHPHVLVVDDDARLRELLRRYLADNGFLVATASDAADARAKLLGLRFDVIVLDLMMPGESGLVFAEHLRRADDVPILMLTAMDAVEDRIAGLESGADDYLVKPFEPRELVLRLNAILRRASPVISEPIEFGPFVFDPGIGELRQDDARVPLTAAEVGLLRALTATVGLAVSRERLGVISRVAERSVDVQINRLRRKVEPDPRDPRYLITVRGEGYALRSG